MNGTCSLPSVQQGHVLSSPCWLQKCFGGRAAAEGSRALQAGTAGVKAEPSLAFAGVALLMFLPKIKAVPVITEHNCANAVQALRQKVPGMITEVLLRSSFGTGR